MSWNMSEKIRLAIAAVDANPAMAPHIVNAIKKNIEERPANEVDEWWESFDAAVSKIKNKPDWIISIMSMKAVK